MPRIERLEAHSNADSARFAGEKENAEKRRIPQPSLPLRLSRLLLPAVFSENAVPVLADITAILLSSIFLTYAGRALSVSEYSFWIPGAPLCAAMFAAIRMQLLVIVVLLLASIFVLFACAEGVYISSFSRTGNEKYILLGKCIAWAALLTTPAVWYTHQWGACYFLFAVASVSYIACCGWRELFQTPFRRKRPKRILIAGAGNLGSELCAEIERQASNIFLGFVDCGPLATSNALGRIDELENIVRSTFADEVIIALPEHPEIAAKVIKIARSCNITAKLAIETFDCASATHGLEQLGNISLLPLFQQQESLLRAGIKRALDFFISIFGLIASAPVMGIVAVIVKLDSPGPVLYRSPRVGHKGQLFTCYKFRTMTRNAERRKEKLRGCNERSGPIFKITHDPRVTRSGRVLRRYSLDELPQLWNVWRGEMSLVGPRPHPLDDCQRYERDHLRRLEVVPGMTGLWQVTARRDPSFQRNMALDMEYIEHGNLWMDLKVLFKTVSVVLQGNGV